MTFKNIFSCDCFLLITNNVKTNCKLIWVKFLIYWVFDKVLSEKLYFIRLFLILLFYSIRYFTNILESCFNNKTNQIFWTFCRHLKFLLGEIKLILWNSTLNMSVIYICRNNNNQEIILTLDTVWLFTFLATYKFCVLFCEKKSMVLLKFVFSVSCFINKNIKPSQLMHLCLAELF